MCTYLFPTTLTRQEHKWRSSLSFAFGGDSDFAINPHAPSLGSRYRMQLHGRSVRKKWQVGPYASSLGGYEEAGGSCAGQLYLQHSDDGLLKSGEKLLPQEGSNVGLRMSLMFKCTATEGEMICFFGFEMDNV